MAFFRILAVAVPIAILALALGFLATGERRYLTWAMRLLTVGIVAALIFFGVLFVDRLVNPGGD